MQILIKYRFSSLTEDCVAETEVDNELFCATGASFASAKERLIQKVNAKLKLKEFDIPQPETVDL